MPLSQAVSRVLHASSLNQQVSMISVHPKTLCKDPSLKKKKLERLCLRATPYCVTPISPGETRELKPQIKEAASKRRAAAGRRYSLLCKNDEQRGHRLGSAWHHQLSLPSDCIFFFWFSVFHLFLLLGRLKRN